MPMSNHRLGTIHRLRKETVHTFEVAVLGVAWVDTMKAGLVPETADREWEGRVYRVDALDKGWLSTQWSQRLGNSRHSG